MRAEEYNQQLGGKIRGLKAYRCGNCRARRVLPKELWQYVRPPACLKCGKTDWRLDMHRYLEWKARKGAYAICNCGGLDYNHRPGSSIWCHQSTEQATEEDYRARFK